MLHAEPIMFPYTKFAKALPRHELAELYAWLDRHRPQNPAQSGATVFEQGLGLFGSPDDAALIDEVVHIAYEDRRRPQRPTAGSRSFPMSRERRRGRQIDRSRRQ